VKVLNFIFVNWPFLLQYF